MITMSFDLAKLAHFQNVLFRDNLKKSNLTPVLTVVAVQKSVN